MNQGFEQQTREAARGEAVAWLARLDAPGAGEADWLEFQRWLEARPENLEAYETVDRIDAELRAASADLLRALDARPAPPPARHERRRPQPRGRAWRLVAGLATAAAASLALVVALRPPAPAPVQAYATAKGETRSLDLADGSHIHLASASRLTVRLEKAVRHVELAEGEAAFDVAKDPARPFVIAAGERDIRVVGTEFDVLRHEGRLRVTVRRGLVAVQPHAGTQGPEPVLLKAGDQFQREAGQGAGVVRQVDPEIAFAWRRGELVYVDQPLDEVVSDLNRYFSTPLHVLGPAARLRFSGVLRLDAEDDVVRRLQGFLQVAADRGPDGVTLRLREANP